MIVFMGVAGSGKSVQGRMLADRLGLPWLATGEFLRMLVTGQRRKDMLAGKLLDDHEIITLVQKAFSLIDSRHEFVIDGFPRTESQADWLLSQVKHNQLSITVVVHLEASESEVQKRLLARGRQDDTDQAIKERFKEYEETAKPILERFKQADIKVININGEQSVKTVHKQIVEQIEPLIAL